MTDERPPRMEQPISLTTRPLHCQHRALPPRTGMRGELWSQLSCSQVPAPASQGASDVLAPVTRSGAHRRAQRSPHALPKETVWELIPQHMGAWHSWHQVHPPLKTQMGNSARGVHTSAAAPAPALRRCPSQAQPRATPPPPLPRGWWEQRAGMCKRCPGSCCAPTAPLPHLPPDSGVCTRSPPVPRHRRSKC